MRCCPRVTEVLSDWRWGSFSLCVCVCVCNMSKEKALPKTEWQQLFRPTWYSSLASLLSFHSVFIYLFLLPWYHTPGFSLALVADRLLLVHWVQSNFTNTNYSNQQTTAATNCTGCVLEGQVYSFGGCILWVSSGFPIKMKQTEWVFLVSFYWMVTENHVSHSASIIVSSLIEICRLTITLETECFF